MKYIIVTDHDCEVGIMFNEILRHDAVAAGVFGKVVSAGYCDSKGNTWGKSTSLGLHPRPEDATILNHTIHFRT